MDRVGRADRKEVPDETRSVNDGCSWLRFATELLAGVNPTDRRWGADARALLMAVVSHNAEQVTMHGRPRRRLT